ncbi:Short-chain dehydrogenase TIC 32 A, chloroplastic [Castilleja foliolosa]|uniref:Short-chain dehydrogenase TIC 32 A, chloroplastic n=1 Tax=Castilleja foliolosa TaxID=1961234 RepID=A0ABD3DV24_9LAMI
MKTNIAKMRKSLKVLLPAIATKFLLRATHLCVNNAGIMFCPNQLSEDGVEIQFATNHLGHFFLTNLLLDKMKETASSTGIEGRIVNLSSLAHKYAYDTSSE